MAFKEFDFQNNAVNKLYDAFIAGIKNVILQAPTGSGKTAILIKLMDTIVEDGPANIAFVWLTPGAGELEEQSWEKTSKNAEQVHPQFLNDALLKGFEPGSVTFLNWEIVIRKGNIAMGNGEKAKLPQTIQLSINAGVKFVLIIDEEHRNQTPKAQEIIDLFNATVIYRASATPIADNSAKFVRVSEDDVIAEGLITRTVVINDQFSAAGDAEELLGDDQSFMDRAAVKRQNIAKAYAKLGKHINPLVLVQFPDDKSSSGEVNSKIESVKNYLIQELGESEDNIAIWLSNEHINVESIEKNDSAVNYLLMKQAVATGWDAPRAKILVKLRLNTSKSFTIQTIGRIRRMPEQMHYGIDILDSAFVYSNDEKYVYDIIKHQMGSGVSQMGLKESVSPTIFGLQSLKQIHRNTGDLEQVVHRLREVFIREFGLGNNIEQNKKILQNNYGFHFGPLILSQVPTGKVTKLEDFVYLSTIPVSIPIVDTNQWGFRYDAVMKILQPYFHVGEDLKSIRAIIADLFAIGDPGSDVKPLLQLRPKERYGFVINNAQKLKAVAKQMDARGIFIDQKDLFTADEEGQYFHKQIVLKKREAYLDNGENKKPLLKNVYEGYSPSNWVKQSKPEIMLEEQLEHLVNVQWVYRSKDHGMDYFSIPYDNNSREYFPDYLVKATNGTTYILETKGKEGQNIDDYSEAKFNALKAYVEGDWGGEEKFAFIRPSTRHHDVLMYNNTVWDEQVDGSPNWHPLFELFDL